MGAVPFLREEGTSLFFDRKGKKLVYYVPEKLFNSNLVFVDGEIYSLMGIFEYAVVDAKTGKQDLIKTMNYPSIFQCKPNRVEKMKNVKPTPLSEEGDYRYIEFLDGDMAVKSILTPELIDNVEEFFKMFFVTTKMPKSIKAQDLWKYLVENFIVNGGNYNVDYHLLAIITAENCRATNDMSKLYRLTDMKDPYDYTLLSIKETPKFNSPFSSLTSEHFDQAVVSAVLLSDKDEKDIKNSPLEKLIM